MLHKESQIFFILHLGIQEAAGMWKDKERSTWEWICISNMKMIKTFCFLILTVVNWEVSKLLSNMKKSWKVIVLNLILIMTRQAMNNGTTCADKGCIVDGHIIKKRNDYFPLQNTLLDYNHVVLTWIGFQLLWSFLFVPSRTIILFTIFVFSFC